MVILSPLDCNQHKNKWCCAHETSAEVNRYKIGSALENALPHFDYYGKRPIIYELR